MCRATRRGGRLGLAGLNRTVDARRMVRPRDRLLHGRGALLGGLRGSLAGVLGRVASVLGGFLGGLTGLLGFVLRAVTGLRHGARSRKGQHHHQARDESLHVSSFAPVWATPLTARAPGQKLMPATRRTDETPHALARISKNVRCLRMPTMKFTPFSKSVSLKSKRLGSSGTGSPSISTWSV